MVNNKKETKMLPCEKNNTSFFEKLQSPERVEVLFIRKLVQV